MTDPSQAIYEGFFSIVDGNITYGGSSIDLYTVPPNDTDFDYVIMKELDLQDSSAKDNGGFECTIVFDVITRYDSRGSWAKAFNVASQILELIDRQDIAITGYQIGMTPYVIDNFENYEETETGTILRKTIRFIFTIYET